MWRTWLRAVRFLKRRGIMWLVKRLTDFTVRLQALNQYLSFLVWTAIYRVRSSSPLKRTLLLHVSLLFRSYRGSLQGVKRPEREVVHSLQSSDEVKNAWSHTSTPSICPYGTDRATLRFYLTPSAVYLNILCLISCSPPYPFTFHLQNFIV
jgi:hypothetical protein